MNTPRMQTSAEAFRTIHSEKKCMIVLDSQERKSLETLQETIDFLRSLQMKIVLQSDLDGAARLAQDKDAGIQEVFFLRKEGGIIDREGKLVSLLGTGSLQKVMAGTHERIKATLGTHAVLEAAGRMLPHVDKAVITDNIIAEINQWKGQGTLLYDPAKVTYSKLRPVEEPIFHEIYQKYVDEGIFRKRSSGELAQLMRDHEVARAGDSPLTGFSLFQHEDRNEEDQWQEFSAYWSGYMGNGAGRLAFGPLRKQALINAGAGKTARVFSLTSPGLITLHESAGFIYHGKVSEVRGDETMPGYVTGYDKKNDDGTARDPHVLTVRIPPETGSPSTP